MDELAVGYYGFISPFFHPFFWNFAFQFHTENQGEERADKRNAITEQKVQYIFCNGSNIDRTRIVNDVISRLARALSHRYRLVRLFPSERYKTDGSTTSIPLHGVTLLQEWLKSILLRSATDRKLFISTNRSNNFTINFTLFTPCIFVILN
jgi:hypothetical protein